METSLTIVNLVLRDKLTTTDVLEIIGALVSDFFVEDLPLDRACEFGSLVLLDLVGARGLRSVRNRQWSVAKLVHIEPHYYRWEFTQTMMQAVRRGDLAVVQWLVNHFSGCRITEDVVMEAAKGGQMEILQLLENDHSHEGIQWGLKCLKQAAWRRHWNLMWWLYERSPTPEANRLDTEVVEGAVCKNNAEQVKLLVAEGFQVGSLTFPPCSLVEWEDGMEIICFLLEGGHGSAHQIAMSGLWHAAQLGDVEFAKWVACHHVPQNDHAQRPLYACADVCLRAWQTLRGAMAASAYERSRSQPALGLVWGYANGGSLAVVKCRETLMDESVRKSWQLGLAQVEFKNPI